MTTNLNPGRTIPARCDEDLHLLAEAVNGFVYHGDALEAVARTIRVLRANKAFAKRLLGLPEGVG
jgi:hypothetical protein